jgi:hypothetical protein
MVEARGTGEEGAVLTGGEVEDSVAEEDGWELATSQSESWVLGMKISPCPWGSPIGWEEPAVFWELSLKKAPMEPGE